MADILQTDHSLAGNMVKVILTMSK